MSNQELYNEAMHLIEGSGGYPKNEEKGYKKMKEAADAGNATAASKYALYLFKHSKYPDALTYFEKSNAYSQSPKEYVTCLYHCAQKNRTDEARLKSYYNNASRVYNSLHGDSYYYFAQLAKLNGETGSVYKEALYYAALGGSTAMPDKTYKEINRERGVVFGKDEASLYIKVNYSGDNAQYFGGFLPCTHTEQSAWNIAKANFTDKNAKKQFGYDGPVALLKQEPKGVLEYQPVAYSSINVDTVFCKFKYDHPNYSTVNTGSGNQTLNWHWYNYHAGFRSKLKQGEFHKQFENASFTKTVPDARLRTSAPRWSEVIEASFDMAKTSATNGTRSKIKTALSDKYNWETKYITVDIENNGQSIHGLKTYFVPFWFFTAKLDFGKTATARVNGATGEVDVFINNPFGLFTPYDDVKAGGLAMYSKERQKVIRQSTPEYKKKKKHLIGLAVQGGLLLIGLFANAGFLNFLVFLSIIAHLALWLVPKEKYDQLFDQIRAKKKQADAKKAEEKKAEAAKENTPNNTEAPADNDKQDTTKND